MKIAITGLTGVGKTTVAEKVALILNIPHIKLSFKDLVEEKRRREGVNINLIEFQKMAEKNFEIDREFDEFQKKVLSESRDYVSSSWLTPWLDETTVNVWLYAAADVRAKRILKREGFRDLNEAEEYIKSKDESNVKRYNQIYGINILNERDKFHICINTGVYAPDEIADLVINAAEKMIKR